MTRGRKTPKMCGRQHPPTAGSPHVHVCGENERHPGQHICGLPTATRAMCGYRW